MTPTMRERLIQALGYEMAATVSGNNMPHASGDPRNRIPPVRRVAFDRACEHSVDLILNVLREPSRSYAPRGV